MSDPEKTTRSWPWLLALLVLVGAFFLPAVDKTFYFRDAFNLFYPYKAVQADYLKDLNVLTWNPWETMGAPFIGELATGSFYPGSITWLVLPPEPALRVFIVGHYFLAAVFMWVWLRQRNVSPAASSCGALAYTLSGYLLSMNGLPDMLVTAAWLPGSLWLLGKRLSTGRNMWLLLFGASLAMPLLAGRAEGVLITGCACSVWLLYTDEAGSNFKGRFFTMVKLMSLAGIIALLLSMAQFLPSWELGRMSMKGKGFPIEVATLWSFHPARILEFVLPSPWMRFWEEPIRQGAEFTGWEGRYPWSMTVYMGLVPLAGLFFWLRDVGRKKAALFLAALVFVVLFSMGRYFPLYGIFHAALPFLRIFRYPEKYMLLAMLMISSAGAGGLDVLMARLQSGHTDSKKTLTVLPALIAVISAILYWKDISLPGLGANWSLQVLHFLLFSSALLFLLSVSRLTGRPHLAAGALLIISFSDLGLANRWTVPLTDPGLYHDKPEALTVIREHSIRNDLGLFTADTPVPGAFRVMRDIKGVRQGSLGLVPGESDFERYRRFELHTLMPNFNFIHGIEEMGGYTAAATADFNTFMECCLSKKALELFNVHYIISRLDNDHINSLELPTAGSRLDYGFRVHYLPDAFPRAYMVGQSVRLINPMGNTDIFRTHNFTGSVILKDHPALPLPAEESELDLTPAEIISYTPERVSIRTRAQSPAYLVLSDAYSPGWEARVDNHKSTVFRANWLVRAVRVPAGDHEVIFTYMPLSYKIGMRISCLVLLVTILTCGAGILVKRKRN